MPAEDRDEGFCSRLFCCLCDLVSKAADDEYPRSSFNYGPPSKQKSKQGGGATEASNSAAQTTSSAPPKSNASTTGLEASKSDISAAGLEASKSTTPAIGPEASKSNTLTTGSDSPPATETPAKSTLTFSLKDLSISETAVTGEGRTIKGTSKQT